MVTRLLSLLALALALAGREAPHACEAAKACTPRRSPWDADLIGTWVGPGGARLTIRPPEEPVRTPWIDRLRGRENSGLLRLEYGPGMAACGLPLHADPAAHPLVRTTMSAKQRGGQVDWKSQMPDWNLMAWGPDGEGENADIHGLELAWFGYSAVSAEPELRVRRCVLRRAG